MNQYSAHLFAAIKASNEINLVADLGHHLGNVSGALAAMVNNALEGTAEVRGRKFTYLMKKLGVLAANEGGAFVPALLSFGGIAQAQFRKADLKGQEALLQQWSMVLVPAAAGCMISYVHFEGDKSSEADVREAVVALWLILEECNNI